MKDFNLDNILNAYVNFLKSTEEKDIASHVSSFFDGASIFPFNYSVAQFIKFASEDKKNVQKYTDALVDIYDIYSNDNFYYNSFKPDRTDWACNTAKHIIEYIKSVEGADKKQLTAAFVKLMTKMAHAPFAGCEPISNFVEEFAQLDGVAKKQIVDFVANEIITNSNYESEHDKVIVDKLVDKIAEVCPDYADELTQGHSASI